MRVNVTFDIPESAAARAPWIAAQALWLAALRPAVPAPSPPMRGDSIERADAHTTEGRGVSGVHGFASATSAGNAPLLHALAITAARRPLHPAARSTLHATTRRTPHEVGYIAYGALRVPYGANRAFDEAVHYLERDSRMRAVIAKVEHSRTEVTLRIVHNGADRYEPDSRTVVWDPLSALRTTAGGHQTPALGLGHELAHAAAASSLLGRGMRTRLRGYDNAEERRVVRGAEAHAARTLGEAARSDHRGTCYRVASPVICRLAA
jgi:hypothetical protein